MESNKLRYLLSSERVFLSFVVPIIFLITVLVQPISGAPNLPQSNDTSKSLAIAREGSSFTNHHGQKLFQVNQPTTVSPLMRHFVRAGISVKEISKLRGHGDQIFDGAFTPDGERIITVGADSSIRLWDAHTGEHLKILGEHTDRGGHVRFSHDGKIAITSAEDDSYIAWNLNAGESVIHHPRRNRKGKYLRSSTKRRPNSNNFGKWACKSLAVTRG